ncbi:hypothetical protein B0H14DRAFT_3130006, partial [Mycena olivaceomarginata]
VVRNAQCRYGPRSLHSGSSWTHVRPRLARLCRGFSRQSCAQLRQASCEAASHHLAPPPSRCAENPRRISPQGPPVYLLCQLWPRQDSGWPSWWPYPRRYRDSAHLKSANRGC